MKKQAKSPLLQRSGVSTVFSSLLCIVIGLALGFLFLLALDPKGAWEGGFLRILKGGFYMWPIGVGREIAQIAPLIMTGLSVGFAFKTGLFNIGAAGQYTVGAFGALFFAIVLKMPWWVCLLASALFGAIWGAIPGILKAYLNVNEVITAIMFNWIGLYAVNTIIYGGGTGIMYDATKTKTYSLRANFSDSVIPDLGLGNVFSNKSTTIAVFLAILVAILIWFIIDKTTFGYELKACGHNKDAARYAGINEKRNIILSMVIAGALAGFGAGLHYLSGVAEWNPQDSTALPGIGFDGISVALLASSNPIGTIFSAAFISHISTGGGFMDTNVFPPEIADVISGVVIYLCAFSLLFKNWFSKRMQKRKSAGELSEAPGNAAVPEENDGKEDGAQ